MRQGLLVTPADLVLDVYWVFTLFCDGLWGLRGGHKVRFMGQRIEHPRKVEYPYTTLLVIVVCQLRNFYQHLQLHPQSPALQKLIV